MNSTDLSSLRGALVIGALILAGLIFAWYQSRPAKPRYTFPAPAPAASSEWLKNYNEALKLETERQDIRDIKDEVRKLRRELEWHDLSD